MVQRYLLCIGLVLFAWKAQSQTENVYDEKVTSAGQVAATISNLGIIGNSFSGSFNVEGFPSCEYPVNSGIEHIFDGGLWVGALRNGQVLVSTGAVDDATGYSSGKAGFEFTSDIALAERSSLFDSPFYDPEAFSHQDYRSVFTDTAVRIRTGPGTSIPILNHEQPLGIEVEFTSLNWRFNFANYFIILNYEITNVGDVPLDSVFIGYWMDGLIRNVNITLPGGTPFYNKGGNGFIDSMNLAYEFDATGDIGFTDSYVASKFLGAEINGEFPNNPNFEVHFNTWQFRNTTDPRYFYPSTDLQRYQKMSSGLNQLPEATWEEIEGQINLSGNRSNLISAGPYTRLDPGDKLTVAFAIVCAKRVLDGNPAADNNSLQRANLRRNAGWAQTTYNGEDVNGNYVLDPGEDLDGNGEITRFILPTPPEIPRTRVEVQDKSVDVYWSDNSLRSVDPISQREDFEGFRLYRTELGFDVKADVAVDSALRLLAQWDLGDNGLFLDNGLESIRLDEAVYFDGDTTPYWYRYTIDGLVNGWQQAVAVTAFDTGDPENGVSSLESSAVGNLFRVFTGTPPSKEVEGEGPFVYPNPYYARADWEGASTFEEDRKLIFANLPARCEIRIYSAAGDLIDVIQHDQDYQGGDIRWFDTYSDPNNTQFSGGEHAWDLLSADNQIIARGTYLFIVTDLDTGRRSEGKFIVIK